MVYLGVYGGMILGLLGWFLGRRAAKKQRGLDEMYHFIWNKARSTSWYITLVAIYILFTLELSGLSINLIPALSILLFIHLGSWSITGFYYAATLNHQPSVKINKMKAVLIISGTVFIIFTVVSAVTGNWKFLLFSLPPVFMIIMLTLFSDVNNKKAD